VSSKENSKESTIGNWKVNIFSLIYFTTNELWSYEG